MKPSVFRCRRSAWKRFYKRTKTPAFVFMRKREFFLFIAQMRPDRSPTPVSRGLLRRFPRQTALSDTDGSPPPEPPEGPFPHSLHELPAKTARSISSAPWSFPAGEGDLRKLPPKSGRFFDHFKRHVGKAADAEPAASPLFPSLSTAVRNSRKPFSPRISPLIRSTGRREATPPAEWHGADPAPRREP